MNLPLAHHLNPHSGQHYNIWVILPEFFDDTLDIFDNIDILEQSNVHYKLLHTQEITYKMADFMLHDSDPDATVHVSYTDAAGSPTNPDVAPTWVSSDPTVLTVAAAADGLSATLHPVQVGASTVTATTTDTNGTVVTVTGNVQVTAGEAAAGSLVYTPGAAPAPATPATPGA